MEILKGFKNLEKTQILVIQSKIYFKNKYKSINCIVKPVKVKFTLNFNNLIDYFNSIF